MMNRALAFGRAVGLRIIQKSKLATKAATGNGPAADGMVSVKD